MSKLTRILSLGVNSDHNPTAAWRALQVYGALRLSLSRLGQGSGMSPERWPRTTRPRRRLPRIG